MNYWKYIVLNFALFCLSITTAQQTQAPRLYSEVLWKPMEDSLKTALGNNKIFLKPYQLSALVALMHYPELKNTKIIIKSKSLNSTMVARPKGLNVFRRKGKRKYIIYINNTPTVKVPVDSVSFNAKVGVIGHEFAHIVEYETKSTWQILRIAFKYGNKDFRANFEKATDQRTIDHGLGWQCYDWSFYVYHYKHTPKEYLEYKKGTYLNYQEIEAQMKAKEDK